jgi:hypothetical protein
VSDTLIIVLCFLNFATFFCFANTPRSQCVYVCASFLPQSSIAIDTGVRVNAIAPGVIASSGLSNYDPAVQASIASNAAVSNYAGRLGTSAECSAVILFLCSPAAAFITGACVNMDGGESLISNLFRPQAHQKNKAWDDHVASSVVAAHANPGAASPATSAHSTSETESDAEQRRRATSMKQLFSSKL